MSKDYSREFKIEAVKMTHEAKVPTVAKKLGISKSALYRWQAEYKNDPEAAFPGKGNLTDKDAEIARLKKELKEAQMEVEILKKATAIFARAKR